MTGQELAQPCAIGGNYADLLDPDKHFTAAATKNARWRINDNLLGNPQFCPVMRLTPDLPWPDKALYSPPQSANAFRAPALDAG